MSAKILIADDEPRNIELLEICLENNGYDTIAACDGLEALNLARSKAPDLIILDVMMPKMDGFNVCRMLKYDEKFKQIPIMLLTARDKDLDKEIGSKVMADSYMLKPFKANELCSEIEKLLK